MNKIILLLPKPFLKQYVLKHFSEISVNDFFQVVERIKVPSNYFLKNDNLNQNSDVLNRMLDIDSNAFKYFKQNALTDDCINKIADLEVAITFDDIDKYPMLLNNNKICEKTIRSIPQIIKKMDNDQINDKIISILEKSNYIPDYEDIERVPLISNNKILLTRAIKEKPDIITRLKELSNELVSVALENNFIPQKQHFYDNPNLKMYNKLIEKAFAKDPSIIVLFDKKGLNESNVMSARRRGFVAKKRDLIENSNLCNIHYIMEDAIKNDPQLIAFLSADCYISQDLLEQTMKAYRITKEDLERNPDLTKMGWIMDLLPEFNLYAAYLTEQEKENEIIKCLRMNNDLETEKLPFLDYKFGGKSEIRKLSELVDCLKIEVNENDVNTQQNYMQMLDKIVDGVVNIRYIQNKFSFKYPDIVYMNDSLVELFNNVNITRDYSLISKYVEDLYLFIGKKLTIEQIKEDVEKMYAIYVDRESIDLSITNGFCNKILNQHRNFFMSKEKEDIFKRIEEQMKLTEKKKNTILNGRKIKKIRTLIEQKDFQQLGLTEEQLQLEINNVKSSILNNKDLKKTGIIINSQNLDYLVEQFKLNGELNEENVRYLLGIDNKNISTFIVNKFEQIKFKLINNVKLSEIDSFISEIEKTKLGGLNYTNYIIGDNNRYLYNLSKLLLNLDDETLNKILNNKNLIGEVANLLPLVNLIDELDINTFINILSDYERVRNKIIEGANVQVNLESKEVILKKIDELISISNAYGSIDDIMLSALGRNIVAEIGEHSSLKYLEFYLKMLNRQGGYIPSVSLKTSNYYLESGLYSDPERLLIGKIPDKNSCIDLLNSAGKRTYNEVLLQNSGDVILIRDNQNKLVSRILVFRKGNVVQMVTKAGEKLPIEIYKEMADQIIQKSISNNDNIEYVFVNTSSSYVPNEDYFVLKDDRFINAFSHADFENSAILLNSKSKMQGFNENNLNLDFTQEPKALYIKPRNKISFQPKESDVTRLRALYIILESDLEKKENMSREFEEFYMREYDNVICGEDWYIAVKKDGTLEELVLPTNDYRKYEEIEQIKGMIELGAYRDRTL